MEKRNIRENIPSIPSFEVETTGDFNSFFESNTDFDNNLGSGVDLAIFCGGSLVEAASTGSDG